MQHWQYLTRKAKHAFVNDNYLQSIEFNQCAQNRLKEGLVSECQNAGPSIIAGVLINYLNIADCYIKLDAPIKAQSVFEEAFQFVLASIRREVESSFTQSAQIDTLFSGLCQLRSQWWLFVRQHADQLNEKMILTIQKRTHEIHRAFVRDRCNNNNAEIYRLV